MGMRIAFKIVANGETIITAYQHWGANTDKALNELSNVLDVVQYFDESDFETQAICMCFGFKRPFFDNSTILENLVKLDVMPDEHLQYNEYLREHPEEIYTKVEFGDIEYIYLDGYVTIDLSSRTFSFDVYEKVTKHTQYVYNGKNIHTDYIQFDGIYDFITLHEIIGSNECFTLCNDSKYYSKL